MKLVPLPQLPPDSRRHRVAKSLREAIVGGHLRPGDRLVEAALSEQLRVSRGPIREALRQLEQEGLVVSYPYRGTEILGLSQEELAEVLVPIRLTLERFAFRHALPALTDQDLDELAKLVSAMGAAAAASDLDGLAEADVRFHELVIARSGQPHCEQIWRTIEPRVRAYFRRDAPAHASLDEVVAEHVELLAALRTRDLACVLPVLEEHIGISLTFGDHHVPPSSGAAMGTRGASG